SDGSTLTIGNSVIAAGSEAQVTTSGLSFAFLNNTTLSAGGSFLTLGSGATVTSEGTSVLALLTYSGSTIELGGDALAMAGGSRLTMDRGLLVASNSLVTAGGSVIDLDAGASLESGGPSAQALVLAFNTEIQTEQDAFLLRPGAALTVNRPLLHLSGAALVSNGGGVLNLGTGASLTSPEVTTIPLLLAFDGSFVGSQADMVQLGASAQINMVRPLLSGRQSDFLSDAGFLHVGAGAVLSSTGEASTLVQLDRGSFVAGGSFTQIDAGGRVSINRPLLLTANASTTFPTGLVSVAPGGQLTTTSPDPLVSLLVGTHQIGTASGAAMFSLTGSATALDTESGLILGDTRPVQAPGGLLFTLASTVTGESAVKVDTALFEASAPLMHLRTASVMTTSRDAVDMSLRAKVTSLGPAVRLDGSSLTVQTGALFNLAGGSFLRVTGDLVELANSSTLSLLNGPVLSANGGSAVNVSGSFVAFTGTGGNRVNITNNLCPCTLVSGVPVALRDGALSTNVTIGPNAIKNPSLGTITLGSANTAAIVLSGPASKVSIAAP
ncbi:MAG TPA: hypothetical protein VML54_14690, partial [Candidatus Limnocylindrales bacterium]|nr:hypothetical protein [Candidatus Limnocylindrales bacterium]